MTFANVAFVHRETGARLEGHFIADTGPTWMVKVDGKPVQAIKKSEWESVPARQSARDIFDYSRIFGGGL